MKTKYLVLCCATLGLAFSACKKDFLETEPTDQEIGRAHV